MNRREFPAAIKVAAFERAGKRCEHCTAPIYGGRVRYDHRIPDGLGGDRTLENCQVLCVTCHDLKTRKTDVPAIAKTKRIRRAEAGVKKPRTIRKWRRFNGDPVHAPRER